ncbi:MAG: hypothetical protein RJB39_291 [Candidatus Parcubacteria bacterium]|jgi:type II secretory pathway pseudopilin PulG
MKHIQTKNNKAGMTLIELVIYFSLLAVLSAVVVSSIFSLFKSYASIKVGQDMETTAIQVLDRMTRDIHDADSILVNLSSFGIPSSYVTLSMNSSASETIKYYVASTTKIAVDKNGVYLGELSLSTVKIDNFLIRYINGTSTQALKIELGLIGEVRNASTTIYKNFYTTVQLRD